MATMRVGVIGDPVQHSLSPVFQQPAFDALGIAATYERWHTPLAELPDRILSLRQPDAFGANVTLPHKTAVLLPHGRRRMSWPRTPASLIKSESCAKRMH